MELSGRFDAMHATYPGGEYAGIHWKGGTESPKTGLEAVEKTEICCIYQDSNLSISVFQHSILVAMMTELSRVMSCTGPALLQNSTVMSLKRFYGYV